ncbi:MAG: hypothetical protein ACYDB5_00880 [bacterium]
MTPIRLTTKYPQSHSRAGGKVPKETSRGYKPRAKRSSRKIILYRKFRAICAFDIYNHLR